MIATSISLYMPSTACAILEAQLLVPGRIQRIWFDLKRSQASYQFFTRKLNLSIAVASFGGLARSMALSSSLLLTRSPILSKGITVEPVDLSAALVGSESLLPESLRPIALSPSPKPMVYRLFFLMTSQ